MGKVLTTTVGGFFLATVAACTAPQGVATNEPAAGVCQSSQATETPWLDSSAVAEVKDWRVREGKQMTWRQRGARIYLAPQAGMTAGWLQELVDCAVSRAGDASDPLAVPGIKARAANAGDGFVIEIEAPTRQDADEVLRRAQALRG